MRLVAERIDIGVSFSVLEARWSGIVLNHEVIEVGDPYSAIGANLGEEFDEMVETSLSDIRPS